MNLEGKPGGGGDSLKRESQLALCSMLHMLFMCLCLCVCVCVGFMSCLI